MDVPGTEWAVVIDGKRLALWDLAIEDVDAVAVRHGAGNWLDAVAGPMQSLAMGKDFVELAAKVLGTGIPVVVSVRDLVSLFVRIQDDLPGSFEDGVPLVEPVDAETT